MDLETLREGAVIGLSVAAPLGPIGVLVVQRSLDDALVGFVTGLGAAVADATYAFVGALATTLVMRALSAAWLLELAGGTGVGWLAWRTFHGMHPGGVAVAPRRTTARLARVFVGTILLTLGNPATVVSFAAIAASQGFAQPARAFDFALGVFVGSALWWLLLSTAVRIGAARITPAALRIVNVASAMVLSVFAVGAFYKALTAMLSW
ncbi:MAG TPA: hypothetical protein VH062_21415 [Polyangiaceae bacterium]|jgi:arginine exporter protein ArgO|nr:hypothetical protein [Polyangiaceae bacterium]